MPRIFIVLKPKFYLTLGRRIKKNTGVEKFVFKSKSTETQIVTCSKTSAPRGVIQQDTTVWDAETSSAVDIRGHFRETYHIFQQAPSALKLEAAISSKIPTDFYHSADCPIPHYSNPQCNFTRIEATSPCSHNSSYSHKCKQPDSLK
jgi:hypothetical protein